MQRDSFKIAGNQISAGEKREIRLRVGELYMANPVYIPITVIHGLRRGPVLFITATLHGDELNGIEIIRRIKILVDPMNLSGTLILVSVANPLGFIMQKRVLPDNRDLNRSFPGKRTGSIASYIAYEIFHRIVLCSTYGIDIHTATHGRQNLAHIRADLNIKKVRELAFAFGSEIILDIKADKNTLRREACKRNIPTITYEAGEPMKLQEDVIKKGITGIKNILASLKMYNLERTPPLFQIVVDQHKWVRVRRAGILNLAVKPGNAVEKGDLIGICFNPFNLEESYYEIRAPFDGLVIAVSSNPAIMPGSPVCHLFRLEKLKLKTIKKLTGYQYARY
jgi:hypothetical protein